MPKMNSKLLLRNWNLPECVLQRYEKNGLTSMFQWQAECLSINGVLDGRNLVYAAPTSAGKTLVTEMLLLKRVLETGKKALFILPFISVAREKLFHMRELFEETGIRVDGYMGGHAPTNGFSSVDIAVCTIEKANGLINRLIEEKNIDQIGMLVIDELHMVGDEGRGYILELLLAKIRFMGKASQLKNHSQSRASIQIVGMSATLPNLDLLADWLDAALYTTDFRPVPLQRCLKVGSSIYDEKLKKIRDFSPAFSCKNDGETLPALCYETLQQGHSVLVFCPTKNWCEKLAENIAHQFYDLNSAFQKDNSLPHVKLDLESLKDTFEQLSRSPVGIDVVLNRTLPLGVAYHHAGLTTEERDIIEAGFRMGAIRILVATSTLSSGVNLPARRVIIRTPMFNRKVLDVRTYLQMTGRAGRKGIDDEGESILVCRPTEKSSGKALLTTKPLPVKSCLIQAGKDELTTSMKRAILEIIVNGIASTYESVMEYTNCTLLSAQMRSQEPKEIKGPMTRRRSSSLSPHRVKKTAFNMDVIESCIKWLVEHEFVHLQQTESEKEIPQKKTRNIVATQLGRAALLSSLPTSDALIVLADLHQAMKALALDTELHLIYLVTPIFCYNDWTGLDWYQYLSVYESLSNAHKNAATLIGVTEQFLMRMASGAPVPKKGKQAEKMERLLGTHRRFYAALALHDLVQEISLSKVCTKYSCNRGMLQQLQQSAASFAGMITTFCQELGWWSLEVLLREFQTRLAFGVQRELMDLMQISLLNSQRARALYAAGVTTCLIVSRSSPLHIELTLRNSVHFQTGRKGLHEADWEVEERRKHKSIHVTGHRGLTEYEAAVLIIEEAKKISGHQQLDRTIADTTEAMGEIAKLKENELKSCSMTGNRKRSADKSFPDESFGKKLLPVHQSKANYDGCERESKVTGQNLGLKNSWFTKPNEERRGQSSKVIQDDPKAIQLGVAVRKSLLDATPERMDVEITEQHDEDVVLFQKDSGCGSRESSLTETQLKLVLEDDSMDESFKNAGEKSDAKAEEGIVNNNDILQQEKVLLHPTVENLDPAGRDSLEILPQGVDQDLSVFSPAPKDSVKKNSRMQDKKDRRMKIPDLSSPGEKDLFDSSVVSFEIPNRKNLDHVSKEKQRCTSEEKFAKYPSLEIRDEPDSENLEDFFAIENPTITEEEGFSNKDSECDTKMISDSEGEPVTLFLSLVSEDEGLAMNGTSLSNSPITLMLDGESSDDMLEEENVEVPRFGDLTEETNNLNKEAYHGVKKHLQMDVKASRKKEEAIIFSHDKSAPSFEFRSRDDTSQKYLKNSLTDSQLCAMLDGSFTQEKGVRSEVTAEQEEIEVRFSRVDRLFVGQVESATTVLSKNQQALSPATIKAMDASFSPCSSADTSLVCGGTKMSKSAAPKNVATLESVMIGTPKHKKDGNSRESLKKIFQEKSGLCSATAYRIISAERAGVNLKSTPKHEKSIFPNLEKCKFKKIMSPYCLLQPVQQYLTPRALLTSAAPKIQEKENGMFSDNSVEDLFDFTSVPSLSNDSPNLSESEAGTTLDREFNFSGLSDSESIIIRSATPETTNICSGELKRKSPDFHSSPHCEKSSRMLDVANSDKISESPDPHSSPRCEKSSVILDVANSHEISESPDLHSPPREKSSRISNVANSDKIAESPDPDSSPRCEKSSRTLDVANSHEISMKDNFFYSDSLILSSQKDETVTKRATRKINMKARKCLTKVENKTTSKSSSCNIQKLAASKLQESVVSPNPITSMNESLLGDDLCFLTDVTNHPSNESDVVASSQDVVPTPLESQKLTASQLGLTIVDVCSHTELFTTFMKEWRSQTCFSMAVATRGRTQKTRCGIGVPSTQGPCDEPEVDAADNLGDCEIVGIAVCWGQQDAYYISLETERNSFDESLYSTRPEFSNMFPPPVSKDLETERRLKALRSSSSAFLKKNCALIAFDIKKQFKVLRKHVEVASAFWQDPSVAAWMLDPSSDQKTLVGLVNQFIPDEVHLLSGLNKCNNHGSISCSTRNNSDAPARIRACAEAICVYQLIKILKQKLKELRMWSVFSNVEMPHIKSLAIMEINGIGFDVDECTKETVNLHEISRQLEKRAYQLAKKQFNLGSPLEVAKVLYGDLGLPPDGLEETATTAGVVRPGMWRKGSFKRGTRIPSSWSTKKEVLEKLKDLHPLPEVILHWRQVTFTLAKSMHPFSRVAVYCDQTKIQRIHPKCITHSVTGRVSVAEPNIQNVSKSFKINLQGKRNEADATREVCIRDLFLPAKGHVFLAADYSQLEIRIFSHLSGDEKLLQILNSDCGDVFKMIAAQWKAISMELVTSEERQRAKQICYGMLYGIGAKALSQQLNIDERSAERFMESFLRSFPAVRSYIRTVVQECVKKGYVETLLGRRRYLPSITDSNMSVRSQAERQAVNTTVQGSAADVIKMATVEMHKVIKKKWAIAIRRQRSSEKSTTRERNSSSAAGCHLVLHLHDELIFEVRSDIVPEVVSLVRSCMENAMKLKVKLPVRISIGPTWGKLEN